MLTPITLTPIGFVSNGLREVIDDIWGGTLSEIKLNPSRFTPECLTGLSEFSHVEIVFIFDQVHEFEIVSGSRHPRGRQDWPRVGIFAQRAKNRPNRLGITICRLVSVHELCVEVEGLDAIDGTPVLDIKPYMKEFAPRGSVRQPAWVTELMSKYWTKST
jgi:tRNA-Thr(GGU) m(6)t(6)A37 methyltransferase TsaA